MQNEQADQTIVFSGPEAVNAYRMLALRSALSLESKGLKMSRGISALKIVRQEFGIKARTSAKALPEYEQYLRSIGMIS
jgi:hypothetical protein